MNGTGSMLSNISIVCAALVSVLSIALTLTYRKQRNSLHEHCQAAVAECNLTRKVAVSFIDACRLIRIDRKSRMNVFTFMRGDKIFTIETLGVWEDNPAQWRELAGLDRP